MDDENTLWYVMFPVRHLNGELDFFLQIRKFSRLCTTVFCDYMEDLHVHLDQWVDIKNDLHQSSFRHLGSSSKPRQVQYVG